jgi:hypothetical protein
MISLINFVPCLLLAQETLFKTSRNAPGPLFWICEIAFIVLMIVALWRVFSKAGQPGWTAIMPIAKPTPLPKRLEISTFKMMAMMMLTNGINITSNHQPGRPAILHIA